MHSHSLTRYLPILLLCLFASRAESQTWSTISDKAPHSRNAGDAVEISRQFYVVGGLIPGTNTVETRIDVYNPALSSWTTVEPAGSFMPGLGGPAWSYAGKLYRYVKNSIYIYDPKLNSWDAPAIQGPAPEIPQSVSPVLVGSRVYFLGAKATNDSLLENYQLPYLELDDLAWGTLSTTGEQKVGLSPTAWYRNNQVYVFPGYMFSGTGTQLSSDISILDLSTNTWTRHPTGVEPFYSNEVTEREGKLILLGRDAEESSTLRTLVFDPTDLALKELDPIRQNPQVTSKGLIDLDGTVYSVGYVMDQATQSVGNDISIEALTFSDASVHPTEEDAFKLYPNPALNELHLRTSSIPSTIRIIDGTGREVLNASNVTSLDVSSLVHGVYTISCQIEDRWEDGKFVKH